MKLENQCVNLELAKRLKELNVKQDSCFRWALMPTHDCKLLKFQLYRKDIMDVNEKIEQYSAFTVAELGEMLPEEVDTFKGNNEWRWECSFHSGNDYHSKSGAHTESDARAKMLIYLIENKFLSVTL